MSRVMHAGSFVVAVLVLVFGSLAAFWLWSERTLLAVVEVVLAASAAIEFFKMPRLSYPKERIHGLLNGTAAAIVFAGFVYALFTRS